MFTEKSWKNWARSLLSLSLSEKGDDPHKYDIKGLLPIVANCEGQLHDAKMNIVNKNPHHTAEDLTEAVVLGVINLDRVAKEIDPKIKLPPLEPNLR